MGDGVTCASVKKMPSFDAAAFAGLRGQLSAVELAASVATPSAALTSLKVPCRRIAWFVQLLLWRSDSVPQRTFIESQDCLPMHIVVIIMNAQSDCLLTRWSSYMVILSCRLGLLCL
jgi:hypothetical protein